MQSLLQYSTIRLLHTPIDFIRYLYHQINWNDRLIGITGARGTGKTTLMLQAIKLRFENSDTALYVSLDDFYFTRQRLFQLGEDFFKNGGRHLFVDEVHKYPDWAADIKSLHDIYRELNIVFSGSSALQLHRAGADLSRRAAMYHLHELSFREFLNLSLGENYEPLSLENILHRHTAIVPGLIKGKSILPLFREYLQKGVYPFYIDAAGQFYDRLINTINVIIENDLPVIENISFETAWKLRKLIAFIADSPPMKVNISELSRKSGLSRDGLLRLLHSLDRANLITAIRQTGAPTGYLTKPDKIYLNNTALLYALNSQNEDISGTARETFFVNQCSLNHKLNVAPAGDFIVDDSITFEVGGKSKTKKQIAGLKNAFIAADDLEIGFSIRIPLWLFGFLY